MRRAQAGQRRHEVDAAIVSQLRGLFAEGIDRLTGHQPRSPLNGRAGVNDVAFHGVGRYRAVVPGQCRRQTVARGDGPGHWRH